MRQQTQSSGRAVLAKIKKLFSREKPEYRKFDDDFPVFIPQNRPAPDPRFAVCEEALYTWMDKLPDGLRPIELTHTYPRIAAQIMTEWNKPPLICEYLHALIFDKRGGRRGFPSSVGAEILYLYRFILIRDRKLGFGGNDRANLPTSNFQERQTYAGEASEWWIQSMSSTGY